MPIAQTPDPPYYAVIFTSVHTEHVQGYAAMAQRMLALASTQDGFLGIESVRDEELGLTVSYWRDLDAIRAWKAQIDHQCAQKLGRTRWYAAYTVRIAKVDRAYNLE